MDVNDLLGTEYNMYHVETSLTIVQFFYPQEECYVHVSPRGFTIS